MTRYTDAYANEIAAFVKAVGQKRQPKPDGRDGLKALILAEAAVRSVREKRTVAVSEIGA
jgi:myo-inositol 2-dehydrogenase/D-chiro-inositol 1-dehydrogenase